MRQLRTLLSMLFFLTGTWAEAKCAQIFYDRTPDDPKAFGRVYATYLQNLLGHFPNIQQVISPLDLYKVGDVEKCDATFYIGSRFDSAMPQAFVRDVAKTQKSVMWMGYGWWKVPPETQESLLGFHYLRLTKLNEDALDDRLFPSFFSEIAYKGEIFHKWNKLNLKGDFLVPFEMTALTVSGRPETAATVLAEARQPVTGETLPYLLRKKNFYYVADVPFSFMHESDRALVIADILFDVLNEKPRHPQQLALLRIEDVHPLSPVHELHNLTKILVEEKVPIHISLIPYFFDPLTLYEREGDQEFVRISDVPEFGAWLRLIQQKGATFIWHGVTHQHGRERNPHTGYTSDDFEFWDANHNQPLPEDSPSFVVNRLESGFAELQKLGITPKIWLTPHYQASSMDYQIFGRVFPWNIARMIYFLNETTGLPDEAPDSLWLAPGNSNSAREQFFSHLQVKTQGEWFGQIFPYEIYGDVYGQRVLPENLGNPQPFKNEHVWYPRTVEEMLEDAKRNRVIRDAWASAFFHPYLLNLGEHDGIGNYPGDPEKLRKLLRGLRELGYQFVDGAKFAEENQRFMRPKPIERK